MNGEVERLKSELDTLVNLKKSNTERMEELLKDEKVREFFDLYKSTMSVSELLEKKNKEFIVDRMRFCDHALVISDTLGENDEKKVYTCVKCGVTNMYELLDMEELVYYPKTIMGQIFRDTFLNSVLIYDNVIDVPIEEVSKIYNLIIEDNPDISLYELRNRVQREVSVIRRMLLKK